MCKILIILEDFFRGGGGRFLKFFEGKRGNYMKKLHPLLPPPPSAVYILNAALPNKNGGVSAVTK